MNKIKLIILVSLFSYGFACSAQNPGDNLFNAALVHDVQMYFSQPNYWDSLTYYYGQIKITGNKTYMRSDSVIINGTVLNNVGVRLKGNSAYGWAANIPSVKLPFKIDFDKYVSGQNYDGLKKLNLHNEDRDPSMMRSKIISDFLIEQNILAPRITYTRVTINGVYWGLYTMVEQLDKTFLSTNFADKSGNLYKALPKYPNWEPLGGSTLEYLGNLPSDYDKIYELKTNNLVNDWSRFVNLLDKINNTPQAEFKDSLEAIMYTDSYIKAWAAMSLFVNFDSYPWLGNNFYIYHRPGDNRFYWIAWDFNLGVGTARHGMSITQAQNVSVLYFSPGAAIRPLATRMLDDPYYYNRYLGWVCKFAQTAFDTTYLSPKIDSIADMIRTDLYADTNKFYNNAVFEDNLNYNIPGFPGLKPFIAKRRIAVLSELQTLGCPALVSIEPATTQNLSVIVYPNPFNNFATIEIQGIKDKWTWTLYNALGQAIQQVDDINDEQLTISKGTLSKGIYLYQVRTKNGMIGVGKLVVELILSIQ